MLPILALKPYNKRTRLFSMKLNFVTISFLFGGMFFCATAQETQIFRHQDKYYQNALALYDSQQYQAAQNLFNSVRETTNNKEVEANSTCYAAGAAIRLNQRGADKLMEDFVNRYPTSIKRNSAFIDVGDYYFESGKYPYALKWYNKIDRTNIRRSDSNRLNFNMGYACYATNQYSEAERYLNNVSNSSTYGSQATYYLGFIAYEQDDYNSANERFDEITDPTVLKEKLSYYQADLNFKSGNFAKAIEMAEAQLPKSDRNEKSELHKIIGESYFNLGRYSKAIPHLKKYRGRKGKWSNTDFYLLGYSYYQQGDFESAVGQFNKIVGGRNTVAQNAYYHLAECYLKLDQKTEALNAFRNAAQMPFSQEIEKDALLNYARLSYEIGNPYEAVPEVMVRYLKKFPDNQHEDEIKGLLVDSFITAKNFVGALELLEKKSSYANPETYQKVAFYRGVELFMENNYVDALETFIKSLKNSPHKTFKARAQFWKAESEYRLHRYREALASFDAFETILISKNLEEYQQLAYNQGYCYFKLKAYNSAINSFKNAVELPNSEAVIKTDALMRLADSYFVTNNFKVALDTYETASSMNSNEKDYALFQKALCHGFMNNDAAKIDELMQFIERYTQSSYQDDALFELGNTYIQNNEEALGLRAYEQLYQQFAQSKLAPQALLRQGLIHYNANRNEQALKKLKAVVSAFPKSQEARQAVETAKLVYIDLGRVSEYATWARNLAIVEVSDSELDNASFEAAYRKYIEGKTQSAIRAFEDYLKEFPNGTRSLQANFSLAQLYFSEDERNKALQRYKQVIDSGVNEYYEQALTRVCGIYVDANNYETAIPF